MRAVCGSYCLCQPFLPTQSVSASALWFSCPGVHAALDFLYLKSRRIHLVSNHSMVSPICRPPNMRMFLSRRETVLHKSCSGSLPRCGRVSQCDTRRQGNPQRVRCSQYNRRSITLRVICDSERETSHQIKAFQHRTGSVTKYSGCGLVKLSRE